MKLLVAMLVLMMSLSLLAGCTNTPATAEPSPEPPIPTNAPATTAPTEVQVEESTAAPDEDSTESTVEAATAAPDESDATEPASESSGTVDQVQIFLIAAGDEGAAGPEIGCGDSVIGVTRDIEPTLAPLGAAFQTLLSLESRDYGESGFVTALYGSTLAFESAAIEDGLATVKLSGELSLSGVCQTPRIQAQLEQTALQFATVDEVDVLIDGVPLEDLLSER